MAARRFVLRPSPPVRALGLTAALVLVAAVLVVVGAETALGALVVVGIVLAAAGVILLALAVVGRRRQTTTVAIDSDGLTIRSAGRHASARWGEINRVAAREHHLYLWTDRDDGETLQIVCPQGDADPQVGALAQLLAHRLDADRGYRTL